MNDSRLWQCMQKKYCSNVRLCIRTKNILKTYLFQIRMILRRSTAEVVGIIVSELINENGYIFCTHSTIFK